MYLKNNKDEKYIEKAFNIRISLLQHDKNHTAIARTLNNLGWFVMLRHQHKRYGRENLNIYEYLAKCSEKAFSKEKYRSSNNEVEKQTTALTLAFSFN